MQTGNVRNLVLTMLTQTLEEGRLSHLVQKEVFASCSLSEKDRRFLTGLFAGTLESVLYLDDVLNRYSKTKTEKMKPVIRNLLRMGVYQLLFMDAVPDHAAVSEAVRLCEKRGFHGLKPFVNGLLRTIAGQKEMLLKEREELSPSLRFSVPEWIIDKIEGQFGSDIAMLYLQSLDRKDHRVTMRITGEASQQRKETVIRKLEEEGCLVQTVPGMEQAVRISGFSSLSGLNAFKEGLITVQDISSMLVAPAADVWTGQEKAGPFCILDVCGAPGGKSALLAERFPESKVLSMDLSEQKVRLIRQTASRLHMKNVETMVHDAREPLKAYENRADLVVCDVPCSGLGVIGRKPDIRYRLKETDIGRLARLQKEILQASVSYVKPGGVLVYSTCTVTKEENEENAAWFAEQYGFIPVDFSARIPETLVNETQLESCRQGRLQLVNGLNDADGFFISVFQKKDDSQTLRYQ